MSKGLYSLSWTVIRCKMFDFYNRTHKSISESVQEEVWGGNRHIGFFYGTDIIYILQQQMEVNYGKSGSSSDAPKES